MSLFNSASAYEHVMSTRRLHVANETENLYWYKNDAIANLNETPSRYQGKMLLYSVYFW